MMVLSLDKYYKYGNSKTYLGGAGTQTAGLLLVDLQQQFSCHTEEYTGAFQ
jgi:hypothetical protein